MENGFFSFTPLEFGIQGGLNPLQIEDYDIEETLMSSAGKDGDHLSGLEDQAGEINTPFEDGFYNDNKAKKGVVVASHLFDDQNQLHALDHQQQQQQSMPILLMLDNYNFETVSSQHGFYYVNEADKDELIQPSKLTSSSLENFSNFDFSFPSGLVTQPVEDGAHQFAQSQIRGSNIAENNTQISPPQSSIATLEILSSYGSAFKMLKRGRQSNSRTAKHNDFDQNNNDVINGTQKLSTEEVMRVAGSRYVQFCSQSFGDLYIPMHHSGYALSGLCEEETKDVEIAHLLLAAAEKVGHKQFDRASRLLQQCEWTAAFKGTLVQRVVCYFAEALRERIEKETGLYTVKGNQELFHHVNGLGTNLAYIACHQEVPFHPVLQSAAIQTMVETVANKSRIHMIDLEIRFGGIWTAFMEALAKREEYPVELLTITAVGVRGKHNLKETGKRLASVAKSLNLKFLYKEVTVSDMQDIREQHLFGETKDDEAVVVYASLVLRTMILRPQCLENLMRVMRNINSCLMVVIEVEANHNSPSFVNRFIDALFYHSAFFDCLETCMKQKKYKVIMEGLLREGIRNIVAAEGSERVARSVKMDVWRAFFAKFRMVETGFSDSSLYQARLVANKVRCATLDRNGEGLLVGWKGTPIHSLSAWKFC